MPVPEELVAKVVSEVSDRMAQPSYAQVAIGTFAEAHPDVSRYVTAHSEEIGGGEAVIHTVFHAQVIAECLDRHRGRATSPVSFGDLDATAVADSMGALAKKEPALASYLASNVDSGLIRELIAHICLALEAG
jgi:hypothetical protein